ncbi:hypothetical protein GAG84_27765, partial [Bacteroides thetaiotaomicron]
SDALAREADIFSIGTNDLIQYTMAVDRGNARVAYLYSPLNPAVLRSIRAVIRSGAEAGIPVGMCGEAAADPLLIPLLLSFGLDEFSVGAASVLVTRRRISRWSKADADARAAQALVLSTEAEVRALLAEGIPERCTAMQAIGYKEMAAALREGRSAAAAAGEIKLRSRQYAKRQLTWFRRDKAVRWMNWDKIPNFANALQNSTAYMEDFGLL